MSTMRNTDSYVCPSCEVHLDYNDDLVYVDGQVWCRYCRCYECNSDACCYICATQGGPGADLLLDKHERQERRP